MTEQHWGPTISGDIVVIGGGSSGIGLLASLLKRDPQLNITLIEPNDYHCYQPAWTLVGGGAYDLHKTRRPLADVLPNARIILASGYARSQLPPLPEHVEFLPKPYSADQVARALARAMP